MASAADIPALVRRLRSPRRLEQVQAADALAGLLRENEAAVQALLAASGGAALARMVVSGSSQAAQRAAARALNAANDTAFEAGGDLARQLGEQAVEEAAGNIPPVLALLQTDSGELQQAAASLASSMAFSSQQLRSALLDAGGVTALLSCLRQHTGPGARQLQYCSGYCALALGALCSCNPEVQRAVAAAGGAAVLVPLLGSSNAVAQLGAAKALQWLAEGCPEGQQVAEAAGAVPALSQLLASNANESARNAAMQALLTLWSAQVQQEANGIPALVHVLQHSQNGAEQRAAFSILYTMHTQCGLPERQAMAAAGAVPALQRFLTVCRQDEAAAGFVQPASTLLDLLNSLPAR